MATKKEWTDEEVQAEIREAVRMVHEDRERSTYTQLHEKYGKEPADDKGAPPKKEGDEDPPKNKPKKSLYWGEQNED